MIVRSLEHWRSLPHLRIRECAQIAGVGERTIEAPLAVRGEFNRQNGPSIDAEVSVWPLLPLLRRQTSEDTPSEPAISTTSLCDAFDFWPSRTMKLQA